MASTIDSRQTANEGQPAGEQMSSGEVATAAENARRPVDLPESRALGSRLSATFASAFSELGRSSSGSSSANAPTSTQSQSFQLQRKNLLHILQICVRRLVETGVNECHQLDDSHETLSQFCVVMDHVMRHGLRGMARVVEKRTAE
jgi:hypothetical protein